MLLLPPSALLQLPPPPALLLLLLPRYAESLAVYDKLIALDPNWYQWTSYVNIMALYPWVLLGAKGPEVRQALAFAEIPKE